MMFEVDSYAESLSSMESTEEDSIGMSEDEASIGSHSNSKLSIKSKEYKPSSSPERQ